MVGVNKYFRHSKISEARFQHLVRCFVLDLTATQTAAITGISVRSVNTIFLRMRRRMAEACERNSPFQGEVEADESYFGPRRVRGRRGRGAGGKTIVFGLLKRGNEVYTEIVPNASKAALQAVIRGRVRPESVLHTDGWRGYDGLVDLGFDKHFRVSTPTTSSPADRSTSTASKASGASLNAACSSSTASPNIPSTSISKKQSSASIIASTTSTKRCYPALE